MVPSDLFRKVDINLCVQILVGVKVKSKKQDTVGITSLSVNGDTFTSDTDIARVLNNQFLSVFSHDDGKTPDMEGLHLHQ